MGDVTITLPYIQGFKNAYPDVQIDFLTRLENTTIPSCIELFCHVYALKGGTDVRQQVLHAFLLGFQLRSTGYDMVIDLQNNKVSRLIRKILAPKAWSEFDRQSPTPAGARTQNSIASAGLDHFDPSFNLKIKNLKRGMNILTNAGWTGERLVLLNPAGFLPSRNWPLDNYVELSRLLTNFLGEVKFLILGIDRMSDKATYLEQHIGDPVINLTGRTSPDEAFAIIQHVALTVSEDSGLMHMSWVSGKPTIALFGSSRSDWSRPLGDHSVCLNSADLECGECMQENCQFGDVRCLTRFTPQMIMEEILKLLNHQYD